MAGPVGGADVIAFWRAVQWPLLVLAIAAVGIGVAAAEERGVSTALNLAFSRY
jgi:hypothetical protein